MSHTKQPVSRFLACILSAALASASLSPAFAKTQDGPVITEDAEDQNNVETAADTEVKKEKADKTSRGGVEGNADQQDQKQSDEKPSDEKQSGEKKSAEKSSAESAEDLSDEEPEEIQSDDEEEEEITGAEEEEEEDSVDSETDSPENDSDEEEEEDASCPFDETQAVGDVNIHISAPEGVFPAGSSFMAEEISDSETQDSLSAAADDLENAATEVAKQYCYDITIFDRDGNEIEPDTSHGYPEVSFTNFDEISDPNLNAEAYHISDEYQATLLYDSSCFVSDDAEEQEEDEKNKEDTGSGEGKEEEKSGTDEEGDSGSDEETEGALSLDGSDSSGENDAPAITVSADSFSYYVIRFTYNTKSYDVNPGDMVSLSEILSAVELSGSPTAVTTNDTDHVTIEQNDSDYNIAVSDELTSDSSITVTISDTDYTINLLVAKSDFYGVLFEDGTLAVLSGDTDTADLETEHGAVQHTCPLSESQTTVPGWSKYKEEIKHVIFPDVFRPVSMYSWFDGCSNLEDFSVGSLDTSKCTSFTMAFRNCTSLESIDLSGIDTSSLVSAQAMFFNDTHLIQADLSKWRINYSGSLGIFGGMFSNCSDLTWLTMDSWQTSYVPYCAGMGLAGTNMTSLDTISMKGWYVSGDPDVDKNFGWFKGCTASKIYIDNLNAAMSKSLLRNAFAECSNLKEVGVYNLVVPNMQHAESMFYKCSSLTSCSVDFRYHPGINMSGMFQSCYNLSYVLVNGVRLDSDSNDKYMFSSCDKLQSVYLDNWIITGDYLSHFSNSTNLYSDHSVKYISMRYADIDTTNLTSLSYMFSGCYAQTIDISGWTGKHADYVYDFSDMFADCENLQNVLWKDFISDKTRYSGSRSFSAMFLQCRNLHYIDLTPLWGLCVNNIRAMFYQSGIYEVDLESLSIVPYCSNSNNYATWADSCFKNCSNLTNINISNWTISGNWCAYIMPQMGLDRDYSVEQICATNWSFPDATTLRETCGSTNARILSVSGWKCAQADDLSFLFYGNRYLTELNFFGTSTSWNASPTNIDYMFYDCESMTSIDIRRIPINFSNITSARCLFANMHMLQHVNTLYTLPKLTDVSGMFAYCQNLKSVDLSAIDSSKITTYNDWMKGSGIRKITLGDKWTFGSGEDNQLPFEKWKNIETKEVVNLWTDYDGSTMAGTYVRIQDNQDPVELNSVYSGLSYDKNSKTLLAYISPTKTIPASICLPESAGYYQLDADYIKAAYHNVSDLYNDISSDFEGIPLTLNLKSVAYLSNSSCSKENNTIWTFDVPKDNTVISRIDIYTGTNYDQLYGYIINSAEHPEVFTLFDSSGNVIEELNAGTRHTYKDLGYIGSYDVTGKDGSVKHYDYKYYGSLYMTDSKLTNPIYPAYEDYLSYDDSMNNYEVVMPPSRYKLEIYNPDQQGIRLTPEKIVTKEVTKKDSDGNDVTETIPDKYIYAATNSSDEAESSVLLTIGNQISYEYRYVGHNLSYNSYTTIVKQNESGDRLSGAAYGFWPFSDGEEGSVDLTKSPYMILYTNSSGEIQLGSASGSYPNFVVKEITAPTGYVLDDTPFILYHPVYRYGYGYGSYETAVYSDAAVTPDKSYQCVCQNGQFFTDCECKAFGTCSCSCCGSRTTSLLDSRSYVYRTDTKIPSISLYKGYDDSFSQYDRKNVSFIFLLEDLTEGTSKEYTLKAGNSKVLPGLISKHKYRLTEMTYSPDGYTPLNNKIGSSGTADDYITSCSAASQNQSAGPASGFVANGNSCTFVYNEGASVSQTITFSNHKNIHTRNLSVAKKIDFGSSSQKSSDDSFSFTLAMSNETLDDLSAQEMTWKKSDGTTGSVTLEDGAYRFSLKDGENIRFSGIPDHTEYTVTEDGSRNYISSGENAEGTIYGSDVSVVIANQKVDLKGFPVTGGNGRGMIYLSGLVLLVVSVSLYLYRRRSRS